MINIINKPLPYQIDEGQYGILLNGKFSTVDSYLIGPVACASPYTLVVADSKQEIDGYVQQNNIIFNTVDV